MRCIGTAMADITALILADHEWFREQFAKLDELQARKTMNKVGLERVWRPLADKLDVHAYIEEKIFYPQLLERGADDPEGERSTRSVITMTFVTACERPTRRLWVPINGGLRLVARGWRMTTIWVRKNGRVYRTFVAMRRSVCARRSASNTAILWRNIPRPGD